MSTPARADNVTLRRNWRIRLAVPSTGDRVQKEVEGPMVAFSHVSDSDCTAGASKGAGPGGYYGKIHIGHKICGIFPVTVSAAERSAGRGPAWFTTSITWAAKRGQHAHAMASLVRMET